MSLEGKKTNRDPIAGSQLAKKLSDRKEQSKKLSNLHLEIVELKSNIFKITQMANDIEAARQGANDEVLKLQTENLQLKMALQALSGEKDPTPAKKYKRVF